ncbi:hypothetical protein ACU4GD_00740 [Cupriavidus basilensis]
MGLPVATQLGGLAGELARPGADALGAAAGESLVFAAPDSLQGRRGGGGAGGAALQADRPADAGRPSPVPRTPRARHWLTTCRRWCRALLLMAGKGAATSDVQAPLARVPAPPRPPSTGR